MRAFFLAILFSVGGLSICHAHVHYNGATHTYTVDAHGADDFKTNQMPKEFSESMKTFK